MIKFLNKVLFNICIFIALGINFYSCNKEISVSDPDSPPPNGFILVDSKPEGFQIYLNNKDSGRMTPDSLTWLTSGTYLFTLKKGLYKDTSVTATVVEGERHSVYVDVSQNQSMLGSLYCSSYPDKAEVFINDSSTGQVTPYLFNLLPGNYNIVYHLKNHSDAGEQLSITSGNRTYSKVILTDTTRWKHYTYETSFIPSHSLTCVVASNSIIIVGTSDIGVFSFDELKNKVIPYPNRLNNNVNCLKYGSDGNLYIGTKGGMVVFNGSGFAEYGPTNTSWPDYNIHAIVIDNTGTCIVGTSKGITSIGGLSDIAPIVIDNGGKIIPVISSLSIDISGNLWAGVTGYGIAEMTSSNKWTIFSSSNTNLINNNITVLTPTSSGEVWAGFARGSTYGGGLSYFDGSGWKNVYPIPSTSKTNAIYIDQNNVKWVATDAGLVKFSSPSNATTFNYDNTGLDINNINGVTGDSRGNIWITTSSGLYRYKNGN